MKNELDKAIQRLCLAFPETEELVSHGMPNYRAKGTKIFAMYAVNHHGDGRIALWLNTPAQMQDQYVHAEPKYFFVPPYVGPGGWLGVRLDSGLAWKRVAEVVRAAYEKVAPEKLKSQLKKTPSVPAPQKKITLEDVDPKNTPRGKKVMAGMRKICLALADASEDAQFGQPVWRAGKKVFARAAFYEEHWHAMFWVGIHAQQLMTNDPRYTIPAYMGHNGWISLDVSKKLDDGELKSLAMESYRHFATRKLLATLPEA